MKDRNLIEGLFLNGDLRILCTTNTLAHGINLPAHTVVIKSTQYLYVLELFMSFNRYLRAAANQVIYLFLGLLMLCLILRSSHIILWFNIPYHKKVLIYNEY